MSRKRLPAPRRRVTAWLAGCCALAALAVRGFVVDQHSPWYPVLWGLQGAAMVVAWVCWRQAGPTDRGGDPDAARLHR